MSIHGDDVKELKRLRQKVDTLSGPNVVNTRDRIFIGQRGRTFSRTGGRGEPDLWVYRTADETGRGRYAGYEWSWSTDEIDPDGDDFPGGETTGDEILIINGIEGELLTTEEHWLSGLNGPFPATWGLMQSTDGRRVALIREYGPEICPT